MTAIVDIYCRTATNDDDTDNKLSEQEATCRAYCETHGLAVGMVHHEIASGFVVREREQLRLMRERYRNGTIQGVVISRFDRLSRSRAHMGLFIREMESCNVMLYCVHEQLDVFRRISYGL